MRYALMNTALLIEVISAVAIIIGVIMLFFSKTKKLGLKIINFAIIIFIIGFGTCVASM